MIAIFLVLLYYSMFIYGQYLYDETLTIVNFLVFVALFVLSILAGKKEIKRCRRELKQDINMHKKYIIIASLITLVAYLGVNALVGLITDTNMLSPEVIRESNKLQVAINLLIWAPITEEIIFRSLLQKEIPNDKAFITISTILFAGVHVLGNGLKFMTIIMALPYIVIGIYFAMLYLKTDNLVINIIMHFLINFVGVLLMFSII